MNDLHTFRKLTDIMMDRINDSSCLENRQDFPQPGGGHARLERKGKCSVNVAEVKKWIK